MAMSTNNKRESGLDLLRIISIFMIIILHSLNHSGILQNITIGTFEYNISYLFQSLSIVAVNCFILITGFFIIRI